MKKHIPNLPSRTVSKSLPARLAVGITLGCISISSNLGAATLFWNGNYVGDQSWTTTTSVTPWATTDGGAATEFWTNGNDAVITDNGPTDIAIWTANVGDVTIENGANFTTTGSSGHRLTVSGSGSGNFSLTDNIDSNGTLRILLNGSSAWDGTITINEFSTSDSGVILADASGGGTAGSGSNTHFVLNGGQLMLGAGVVGNTATIGSLSGTGTVKIRSAFSSTSGVRTLLVDQSTNTTFTGTFGDNPSRADNQMAFTKAGAGRLIISSNSGSSGAWGGYAGATSVNEGSLYLVGSSDTTYSNVSGQGTYSVANNATLGVDGTITFGSGVSGAITVANGGILDPGQVNQVGTMTLTGGDGSSLGLVFEGDANILFTLGSSQDSIVLSNSSMTGSAAGGDDSILFTFTDSGDVTEGQTFDLIDFGGTTQSIALSSFGLSAESLGEGWSGNFAYSGDGNLLQFTVSSIPEPTTYAMILSGLALGMAIIKRRRQ
ncbi:PEP-CTERM sorting domain-containing protein [Cerasicoccus maritimus]|uniref:PEP-CTERM sorting domain-containing protein n=1 Tax=Cerasicoccus maritimus TaxID=490089 RepID=UPI0028525087|nr:PEP-CTERM sorting domain-containing protein [Cerasicoccus maritimus]